MFMGSGSSMVSCKKNNRRGIGFEIDRNYFNLTKNRIDND